MKLYFPVINLLRGVAATMVCVFHFIGYAGLQGHLFDPNGFVTGIGKWGVNGVFVFFVISGFVIPFSLSKDHFNLKQFPRFLLRRFVRIEIPYLASILLILLVGFLFALKNDINFTVNLQQFLYHIVYIIPFSTFEWYNVIYWTLAIEFQFYVVIGMLYFFLSSPNKILVITALVVFGLSGFIVNDNRFIFSFSTIFVQGMICFLIKTNRMGRLVSFILLGLFGIATAYLHSIEIAAFSLTTVGFILFAEVDTKFTRWFGNISYSLYLTHGLIGMNILYLFSRYMTSFSGIMGLVLGALLASFLFSYLFWWAIENPSRKLSRKVGVLVIDNHTPTGL